MTLLTEALGHADLLLIDGLHAFDFSLDEKGLIIQSMDGRELKRWHFVPEQLALARFDAQQGCWLLDGEHGSHQLICLDAISAAEEDDDQG